LDAKSEPSSVVTSEIPSKLDEGLDSFFPSVSLVNHSTSASANSLDANETLTTIKESSNDYSHSTQPLSAKPHPQPRKILRKFGFNKQNSEQAPAPSLNEFTITKPTESSTSHITLKNDDFIRSSSPTFFAKRSEHVSICSEPESGRVSSPLPGNDLPHNEFLAEIRAKQEKRSHGSTPLNEQLTFAGTIENMKRTSPEQQLENNKVMPEQNNNTVSSNSFSVAKRATI